MRSIGKAPGSILVSYSIHRAAKIPEAARELGLGDDELVHSIIRIRTADDTIMALNYTYLPVSLFPNFDLRMLEGSLYNYISQHYDIDPTDGSRTISAVLPTPQQKNG